MKLFISILLSLFSSQVFGTSYANIGQTEVYKRSTLIVQGKFLKLDAIDKKGNLIVGRTVRTGPGAGNRIRTHITVTRVLLNKQKVKMGKILIIEGDSMGHGSISPNPKPPWWAKKEQVFVVSKFGSSYRFAYPMHSRMDLSDFKGSKLEHYIKTQNGTTKAPYRTELAEIAPSRELKYRNSAGIKCPVHLKPGKSFGPIHIGMSRIDLINLPIDHMRKIKGQPGWYIIGSFEVRIDKDKVQSIGANLGRTKSCVFVGSKKIKPRSTLEEISKYFKECSKLKNLGTKEQIRCKNVLLELEFSTEGVYSSSQTSWRRAYPSITTF